MYAIVFGLAAEDVFYDYNFRDTLSTMHQVFKTRLSVCFAVLISFILLTSTRTSWAIESKQQARVIKVVDGDTIVVEIGWKREHLRLIGIDTPESRTNQRAEKQSRERQVDTRTILLMGNQAANYTRTLLPKKSTVYLEFDVTKRDHYGRLLAYVWLPNETMANEEILKAGYAYLLTVPPNVKHRQRLAAAFSAARSAQRGLWTTTVPPARRNIR